MEPERDEEAEEDEGGRKGEKQLEGKRGQSLVDWTYSLRVCVCVCVYSRIERGVMIYDSRLGKSDGDEKRRRATE